MKQLQKGLTQLAEEGAVQAFKPMLGSDYILGAVGVLQFDVTKHRLKEEYGADIVYESVDFGVARWISCTDRKRMEDFTKSHQASLFIDAEGHLAYLTAGDWRLNRTMEQWPEISFFKTREYS